MGADHFENINIQMEQREPLINLDIKVDHHQSHIELKNPELCSRDCQGKPCTYICPSFVFEITDAGLTVFYQRCIECGACKLVCPKNNVVLNYPAGGYGVIWKY